MVGAEMSFATHGSKVATRIMRNGHGTTRVTLDSGGWFNFTELCTLVASSLEGSHGFQWSAIRGLPRAAGDLGVYRTLYDWKCEWVGWVLCAEFTRAHNVVGRGRAADKNRMQFASVHNGSIEDFTSIRPARRGASALVAWARPPVRCFNLLASSGAIRATGWVS